MKKTSLISILLALSSTCIAADYNNFTYTNKATMMPSRCINTLLNLKKNTSKNQIENLINYSLEKTYNFNQYRNIKFRIYCNRNKPDHIIVYLFYKNLHKFSTDRINVDPSLNFTSITKNYIPKPEALEKETNINYSKKTCPDSSIQFISFCPNDDQFEISITRDVAFYARSRGLKTIELLNKKATTKNYLNYMSCPKLIGDFYDGDANPYSIATNDGEISSTMIDSKLKNKFRYKVTNIWVACEAFNNPLKDAVINTAQAQKYAAGINDLSVGPSDRAAKCAMQSAIDGNAMTAAFNSCDQQYDTPTDHWGFDGKGSDYFGK